MINKYVLITGSSRGIGRATALKFASEGFHVFLNCCTSFKQLEEVGREIHLQGKGSCQMIPGDVGNPDSVKEMFGIIEDACPCLDVLVNNAAISHIGLLTDLSTKQWNRMIQTNLSSAFYCSREAIPGMIARKSGKIINISSIWGRVGASCEVAYSATKAGLDGFTKALAKELAPSNVQVNAISCGVVDTDMNSSLSHVEKHELKNEIPAGRFATVEEVAELIFDISNGHNYLTGQIIGLDGGYL